MNTSRNTILIVLLFAAAAFIGGFLLRGDGASDESATPTPSVSAVPATSYAPQLHTVTITSSGVSPSSLTIRAGDAVRFRNATSTQVWPASDPHPSHTLCEGFDAKRGLGYNEEYTLTFPTAKTCMYHSHLDPSNRTLQGTIIVQ